MSRLWFPIIQVGLLFNIIVVIFVSMLENDIDDGEVLTAWRGKGLLGDSDDNTCRGYLQEILNSF